MRMEVIFISAILLNLFAYLTIRLRPKLFNVKLFKPMIWNIKLSLLPYLIMFVTLTLSFVLMYFSHALPFLQYLAIVVAILGLGIWMLILPNSGYLITELNLTHREMDEHEVPIWYDIVSVLSFALSGIVNTLVNIVILQILILIIVDPVSLSAKAQIYLIISALIINILVSIGVYLGRSIRFNSWDILHISSFIKKLKNHFTQEGVIREFVLFVIFHTIFFMIVYYMLGIPYYFIKV